jgi:FkbM family methyltransferase
MFAKPLVMQLDNTSLKMRLPPLWHGHPKLLYTFGWRFDPELPFLANHIRTGSTVLDIGANVGTWSLILANAVGPSGYVLAFEPAVSNFETLRNNVELNSLRNVLAFNCALSNLDGKSRLFQDLDPSRNSLGRVADHRRSSCFEEVTIRALDSVYEQLSIQTASVMKIDVEGAEPLVLQGAQHVLERFKPIVMYEINPGALDRLGFRCDSAWNILADKGYRFYDLNQNRLKPLLTCPAHMSNVWAIHPASELQYWTVEQNREFVGERSGEAE